MAEFFTARRVADVRVGFRPARRTATEAVAIDDAVGRVLRAEPTSTGPLPGFARSTVDGFAVVAADTYGASDALPAYLDITGAVQMGRPAEGVVRSGQAHTMPTGGAIPQGADAVVMVEHANLPSPTMVEVTRPAAPGDGIVSADEDVPAGDPLIAPGRALRPADLALLAAAGVTTVEVAARPLVTIVSTGDEVVPPDTQHLEVGQVRDATASGLAGQVIQAGGVPHYAGIVPDDPEQLEAAVRKARTVADLVVVSAGSSVGSRDATGDVIASLADVWCHGLAIKPGKPTLLAGADAVPIIGLPGNPLSALVVFRTIGMPLIWLLAGCESPPPAPSVRARLSAPIASAAGRLDIVAVTLADGVATPLRGPSALLSLLTRADGHVVIDEPLTGLAAGSEVVVELS